MELVILLSDALSRSMRDASVTSSCPFREAAAEFFEQIRPVHPHDSGPDLARYYRVEIADPARAEAARQRLASVPGVEAAYLKPDDALP
jgi:hypothetical protein